MTPEHHEERLCAWAEQTGRPVLSLDYGKAPECESNPTVFTSTPPMFWIPIGISFRECGSGVGNRATHVGEFLMSGGA